MNVCQAYNHMKDFKSDLLDIRGDIEKYGKDWTAWILPQQEKQTLSLLCNALLVGNSMKAKPKQKAPKD